MWWIVSRGSNHSDGVYKINFNERTGGAFSITKSSFLKIFNWLQYFA